MKLKEKLATEWFANDETGDLKKKHIWLGLRKRESWS